MHFSPSYEQVQRARERNPELYKKPKQKESLLGGVAGLYFFILILGAISAFVKAYWAAILGASLSAGAISTLVFLFRHHRQSLKNFCGWALFFVVMCPMVGPGIAALIVCLAVSPFGRATNNWINHWSK